MRLKIILLFSLIISFVFSNETITPSSLIKKDFDLFLNLETNQKDYNNTISILENISNVNKIIFEEYAKKIDYDETLAVSLCMNAKAKDLVESNADCIAVGLTLKKALELTPLELSSVISKIDENYPQLSKELKILNSPIPFTKIVSSSKDIIFDIYLNTTNSFLLDKLNYKLPIKTLQKIKDDEKFEEFLSLVISNPKLNFLQSSFLEFDDTNYNQNISFILALNRILNKKFDEQTIKYLKNALSKTTLEYEKDKINFWLYLITKDENNLNSLVESLQLNMYTLYAKQLLKKDIQITDDFKLLSYDFLNKCSNNRKILIHSFAKTLSSFDESKISSEFDLGLMQINFKKVKDIIKINNFEIKTEELVNPKININFFSYILNEIETDFYHPLMFFYAYENDSIYLKDKLSFDLFNTKNIHDPYLSLELLGEEKIKNFIVNYITYTKFIENKNLSLEDFFKNLFEPSDFH